MKEKKKKSDERGEKKIKEKCLITWKEGRKEEGEKKES